MKPYFKVCIKRSNFNPSSTIFKGYYTTEKETEKNTIRGSYIICYSCKLLSKNEFKNMLNKLALYVIFMDEFD